jgi:predicted DNA-binding transcriptional regulator AlpA
MSQLWTKKQAAKFANLHPEHVMRLARTGKFPRPIKIGDGPRGAVRFDADEIEAWLRAKLAARRG